MSDFDGVIELGTLAAVEVAAFELAARGEELRKCPNCGTPLIGPYCAVCGQERDTHRRSLGALIHDFVVDIVSFDSRVLRTARALAVQPGELPAAFREGRTQRYVPAVRLYLFVSLIFFLVLSVTGIAILQLQVHIDQKNVTIAPDKTMRVKVPPGAKLDKDLVQEARRVGIVFDPDSNAKGSGTILTTMPYFFKPLGSVQGHLAAKDRAVMAKMRESANKEEGGPGIGDRIFAGFSRLADDPGAVNAPLTAWIPRILFLLLPAYAGVLALFYISKRKDFYFVDHLIFSLNLHTAGFVLLLLAAAAAQVVSGTVVLLGLVAAGTVYFALAMKRFYGQNWFWTGIKFAFVNFVYIFFIVLPTLGVVIALSLTET